MDKARENGIKWDTTPLDRIDKVLLPVQCLKPMELLTLRWNLLALIYDLRYEAVEEFTMRIVRKRKGKDKVIA